MYAWEENGNDSAYAKIFNKTWRQDVEKKIIFSSLKVYMIARGEISSQTAQHFPSEISFSEKKKN